MKRFLVLLNIATQTLRSNTLHTFLSTLGLVIGVAALVAILSLGDGLEKYARDQISSTTSLESIVVSPRTRTFVDGVSVANDSVPDLKPDQVEELSLELSGIAEIELVKRMNTRVRLADDSTESGAYLDMTRSALFSIQTSTFVAGSVFSEGNPDSLKVVMNQSLASNLFGSEDPASILGKQIQIREHTASIVGVVESSDGSSPVAYGPYGPWQKVLDFDYPAGLLARAIDVERVPIAKEKIENWFSDNLGDDAKHLSVITNQFRVEQAERGIKLFKIVMGLITGIAVLVGGIGIMNVLLISINERTKEIGVRKATGAQRADIVIQFLTESVTISIAGSIIGLMFGLGMLAIAVPIIQSAADVPFGMSFSTSSLTVVLITAVIIGIVFGTYPAWRAAKLSPVDAIRHE